MSSCTTDTVTHKAEASEPSRTPAHTRNLSTVSSATLLTNTTLHSQPYEPLLRPISPASREYYDLAPNPSKESDRNLALPRWSQNNILSREGTGITNGGLNDSKKLKPITRFQMRRWSKRILQTIMSLWSIYSTVRYLLAFTIYQSITGQVVSLVLGAATGLSFAFSSCGSILNMAQTTLLLHGISVKALLSIRATLYYMASCCLLGPSVVNLVLLFLWKRSPDLELQTRHRCKLDVDLVWSTTYSLCNYRNRTWGRWVALSALRLALTLIIIIAFHALASSSQFTPIRGSSVQSWYTYSKSPATTKSNKSHIRLESSDTPLNNGRSQSSVVMPRLSQDPALQRQNSDSTLSAKSSPRNRLRSSRSRWSASDEDEHQTADPLNNSPGFPDQNTTIVREDGNGLFDRFLQAVAQITRETEDAISFARSGSTSSGSSSERRSPPSQDVEDGHRQYHYANENDEDDDDFYSNGAAHTVEAHNYDQSHYGDEHVRMLNGYVRRMPTIESMGSHERPLSQMSSNVGGDRGGTGVSRPPTRNTLTSWGGSEISGSEPRSRPNSLSAQAEALAGMYGHVNTTEIGELMMRGDSVRMIGSQHELSAADDRSEALGEFGDGYASGASGTTGSKDSKESTSGASFHTASTGSSMSLTSKLADATGSFLTLPVYQSPLRNTIANEVSKP